MEKFLNLSEKYLNSSGISLTSPEKHLNTIEKPPDTSVNSLIYPEKCLNYRGDFLSDPGDSPVRIYNFLSLLDLQLTEKNITFTYSDLHLGKYL